MTARKLITGLAHRFRWSPPDGYVSIAPSLVVDWPAGSQTYALTATRSPDTVSAISADRRSLTVTWGLSGSFAALSAIGSPSPAVIRGEGIVGAPVRVVRIVSLSALGGVLELAEALPLPVDIVTSNPTLYWSEFSATIPALDLPATPTRGIRWTIDYTSLDPISGEAVDYRRDRDVLHVVAMEFGTGLGDADLLGYVPDLRSRPVGQSSWRAQRDAALDELIGLIRTRIAPRVEDILPGRAFIRAHAYLSAATILDGTMVGGQDRTTLATYYRERAVAEIEAQLALVDWSDLDRNGAVDPGEQLAAVVSRMTSRIGSTFTNRGVVDFQLDAAPYLIERARVTDER
jgi:hypothetical protein